MRRILLASAGALLMLQSIAGAQCDPVPGLKPLLKPGTIILLGEIHGTVEGPRAVEQIACAALRAGLDVAVGLEIPMSEEAVAIGFVESAGTADDMQAAITGTFWQQDYQDGRASAAMLDLIVSLRNYRSERLHLFFIDDQGAPQGRDQFMADRVVATSTALPNAVIIVLTGNVHNRLTMGTRFNADFDPMGFHVRDLLPDAELISLNITYSGGDAWVCIPECGVTYFRRTIFRVCENVPACRR